MQTLKRIKKGRISFRQYLMENISAADYAILSKLLGESPKFTTQLINDPSRGTTKHLAIIMTLIKKWAPSADGKKLMDDFGFGSNNISEVEKAYIHN